jgi:hypothetical protein
MHTVTSFHSADVEPDRLNAITADYFALERARIYRRLFVTRFGLLALGVALAGAGLHWLPVFATWFTVGLFLVIPAGSCVVELRCSRRLARRLAGIPHSHRACDAPSPVIRKS